MVWHRLLLARALLPLGARPLPPQAAHLRTVCAVAAGHPPARALARPAGRQPAAAAAVRSVSASAAAAREHPECGYPGTMEGITYL